MRIRSYEFSVYVLCDLYLRYESFPISANDQWKPEKPKSSMYDKKSHLKRNENEIVND